MGRVPRRSKSDLRRAPALAKAVVTRAATRCALLDAAERPGTANSRWRHAPGRVRHAMEDDARVMENAVERVGRRCAPSRSTCRSFIRSREHHGGSGLQLSGPTGRGRGLISNEEYQPHLPADLGFTTCECRDVRVSRLLARTCGIHGFAITTGSRASLSGSAQVEEMRAPGALISRTVRWPTKLTRRWDGADREVPIGNIRRALTTSA
jgi:hypothetical protein